MAATLGLAPTVAHAGELTHEVRSGETLEALARHYYGSSWKAVYVIGRNTLDPRRVSAGERIVIPASWTYRVKRGDSAAGLAERFLGDADRYQVLLSQNSIKDPLQLQPGTRLLMPFHLFHRVERGESWSAISKRYYRTHRLAGQLAEYNPDIESLQPGQRVVVPIFDWATVDVRSKGTPSAPRAGSRGPASASRRPVTTDRESRARMKSAMDKYQAGAFKQACTTFEDLLSGDLDLAMNDRGTIIRYLGFCSVAYDDRDAAHDYFRKWLEIEPSASLDPVSTSPKIRAVFEEVLTELRQSASR